MTDMIISLIALVSLGLKRIYHASYYQEEKVLAGTLGLEKFPSHSTIYRFLQNFATLTMCRRIYKINKYLTIEELEKSKEIIVDGDWATLRTHENQKEGAVPGYNVLRKGEPCFQALTYYANGFCIKPEILAGNEVPMKKSATITDLKEVRTLCGRIDWIRLDGGFMSQDMLEELDTFSRIGNSCEKVQYVVNVGTLPAGVQEAIKTSNCRDWKKLSHGSMYQERPKTFIYQNSQKQHRLILLKKYLGEKRKWVHYALVTNNEKMSAFDLCYFYQQRQGSIEGFFNEGKNDYSLENLPCQKLLSNCLYFAIISLLFNLLIFFRRDTLKVKERSIRLSTFQRRYLHLDISYNGKILFIPRSMLYYRRILAIFRRLRNLNISLEYRLC